MSIFNRFFTFVVATSRINILIYEGDSENIFVGPRYQFLICY